METSYCVYCHTNKQNGKKYVGITKNNVKVRWNSGKNYANNLHFSSAIEKYGWDGFDHTILFDGLTADEAKRIEIRLIAEWNLQDRRFGYNQTAGGDGALSPSDEVRKRMSEAAKSDKRLEQLAKAREKSCSVWTGAKHTSEAIQKMSEAKIGHVVSEETRKAISEKKRGKKPWNAGVPWSEEAKAKMREAAKHRPPVSEETRRRRSESLRKYNQSKKVA